MKEVGSRQVAMMRAARSQGVFDAVAQGNNYHAAMRLAERGLFARVPFRTYVFTLTDAGERRLAALEAAE
jgi:hypothetical protein